MNKAGIQTFARACMVSFNDIDDCDWVMDPLEEGEFVNYYHEAITHFFCKYVEQHKQSLADCFEEERHLTDTAEKFKYRLLVSLIGWHFRNGYSHVSFLRFTAWTIHLSFRFYDIGRKDFPKAAMFVIAETLEYFLEKAGNWRLKQWFDELVLYAKNSLGKTVVLSPSSPDTSPENSHTMDL